MIYIASPFFNPAQLKGVQRLEQLLTFYHLDHFSPRLNGVDVSKLPEEERKSGKRMTEVFESNISAMNKSTLMLACVDGKDQGTNFEMGYFYRGNITVGARCNNLLTWSSEDAKSNLMISQATGGHLANLDSVETFLKWLRSENSEVNNFMASSWRFFCKKYHGFNQLDVKED